MRARARGRATAVTCVGSSASRLCAVITVCGSWWGGGGAAGIGAPCSDDADLVVIMTVEPEQGQDRFVASSICWQRDQVRVRVRVWVRVRECCEGAWECVPCSACVRVRVQCVGAVCGSV